MIAAIVYLIFILIGLAYIFRGKNKYVNLAKVYVFSLPFFGLMYDVGISLTIDRFWAVVMLLDLLFNKNSFKIDKSLKYFLFFIFYVFSITIILSQNLPDTVNIFPPLRGKYRYITQIIMWGIQFTTVFYFAKYLKTEEDIKQLLKTLIFSCATLSLIGIFQYLFYKRFGYNIIPIGFLQGEERSGMFDYLGMNIFRVSSLGGEPKHFAYTLSIVLPLMIFSKYFKLLDIRYYFLISTIMLINLFLTFSTQGYFLFLLNIFVGLIFIIFYKGIKLKFIIYSSLFFAFIIIFLKLNPLILDLIKLRTIERLADPSAIGASSSVEDWNEAVLGFINAYPQWIITGVGLGNIHLYAQDYIPEYADYMIGNVFVAKSGFLRLLSETGIIGLFIFVNLYIRPLISIFKYSKNNNFFLLLIISSIYVFLDFLISQDGPGYIFFIMGILYVISCKNFISHRDIY